MSEVAARKASLLSRFAGLVSPLPKPEQTAPRREPTREEMLKAALGAWVDKAPDEFWRELDRIFADAHTTARMNLNDHATVAFWLGFESAVESIAKQFNDWRG